MSNFKERIEIREKYRGMLPLIEKDYPRFCPYFHDWNMTPIENSVWYDIRLLALPFYPQFPIGKYFVDFADPIKKIVIEVDGKEFHKDLEKDKIREEEIRKMGWSIWRITGRESFVKYKKPCPKCGKPCNPNGDTESLLILDQIINLHYDRTRYYPFPSVCDDCIYNEPTT